jgi:hypothetical protein
MRNDTKHPCHVVICHVAAWMWMCNIKCRISCLTPPWPRAFRVLDPKIQFVSKLRFSQPSGLIHLVKIMRFKKYLSGKVLQASELVPDMFKSCSIGISQGHPYRFTLNFVHFSMSAVAMSSQTLGSTICHVQDLVRYYSEVALHSYSDTSTIRSLVNHKCVHISNWGLVCN